MLQVPISWCNGDLVQEVHPREVMTGHRDDVGGQRQRRAFVEGQVRHLQGQDQQITVSRQVSKTDMRKTFLKFDKIAFLRSDAVQQKVIFKNLL